MLEDDKGATSRRYGLLDESDPNTKLLVPLPGRPWGYVRHDNRDTLVVRAALGEHQKPIHAAIYAEIKNSQLKRGDDKPKQYRIHNFARKYCCSDRTVSAALHDLADAGLIEIEADLPWQLSPIDGNLYRWICDEDGTNWAERAVDAYVRDVQATLPASFREAQDDLSAGLAMVAEAAGAGTANEATTLRVTELLAEAARLLRGESPEGPSDDDGPTEPDPPEDPEPSDQDEQERFDDYPDDDYPEPELPGYGDLAAIDMRADKHGEDYQREAKSAYKRLLNSKLAPTPEEIVEAYAAYDDGLVSRGDAKLRRPLARWLAADDEWGAATGIRRLRTASRKSGRPAKREYPEQVKCPKCGQLAKLVPNSGGTYRCENVDCDETHGAFGSRYQFIARQ